MPGYPPQPPGPPAGSGRRRWPALVAAGIIGGVIASPRPQSSQCRLATPPQRPQTLPTPVTVTVAAPTPAPPAPSANLAGGPPDVPDRVDLTQAISRSPSVRAVAVTSRRREGCRSSGQVESGVGRSAVQAGSLLLPQAGDALDQASLLAPLPSSPRLHTRRRRPSASLATPSRKFDPVNGNADDIADAASDRWSPCAFV